MQGVQVQFAIDDADAADRIISELLADRLVACGQRVGPVTSRYRWKGAVESSQEWLVLLKTTDERADLVVDAVIAAHSYEEPEVLVLPISGGSASYLDWIAEQVSTRDERGA